MKPTLRHPLVLATLMLPFFSILGTIPTSQAQLTNASNAPVVAAQSTAQATAEAPAPMPSPSPVADPNHPLSSVPGETKEQRDARMAWWRDAKFGMFVHWGVYSVPAGYYNG